MKVKTNVKSGGGVWNHNEKMMNGSSKGLKIKTNVKSGGGVWNHNEKMSKARVR